MHKIANSPWSSRKKLLNRASRALQVTAVLSLLITEAQAAVDCLDTDSALTYWRPIQLQAKNNAGAVDDLALELVSCLASPNPELRDRIGYELFTFWLRNEKVSNDTRRSLLRQLTSTMTAPAGNVHGDAVLARSFSALILAEIMRSDSINPFMSADERQSLLIDTIASFERETDYRGLDAELGWIHPIAHMSDLLWRFALHTETTAEQAESILAAVRTKIAPTAAFYGFNESDRLARVVTTVITRELVETEKLTTWLSTFDNPSSMDKWPDAFASPQGMAELHNTKLFLRALADQLDGSVVDPLIAAPLAELVQGFTQLI